MKKQQTKKEIWTEGFKVGYLKSFENHFPKVIKAMENDSKGRKYVLKQIGKAANVCYDYVCKIKESSK